MKKSRLEQLRKGIDGIDREMLDLLNRRAELVLEVVREKRANHLPGFDPSRERRIVERMKKQNPGPLQDQDVEIFLDAIFKIYRSLGQPLMIAYFGPIGTFTHQAALRMFGEKHRYLACKTVEHVFLEVERSRADYGVVPVENSSEGVVSHTLDMFVESDLQITAEVMLEIHQYLLSREPNLSRIKRVYTHPQPLSQCRRWLEERLPAVEIVETETSTAAAAERARREPGSASIGSVIGARIYGLNIVAEKIEDNRQNITRFLVIGRSSPPVSGQDKTSILLSIKDRVGALHDMLIAFKKQGINLTRIESRPSKKKAWEYFFFVDLLGHRSDPKVKQVLERVRRNCVFLKVLGSYPNAGSEPGAGD